MGKFVAIAAAASAMCLATASAQRPAPALQSFEFLGCSGGWNGELEEPEVWRVVTEGRVSFLTHSVGTCGLVGRAPVVTGDPELLNLNYQLQSDSDGVVMCDCEYWAKFTFGADAHYVRSVTFDGQKAVLRGEWPED